MSIILTKNLTKYYGRKKGIENLNLEVKEGEVFGFIGPNGAGKSTTIRTLLGFIKASSGEAGIFGKSIHTNLKDAKKDIGYLPSEVTYYDDMTVGELLRYSEKFYRGDYRSRIKMLCDYFELDRSRKIDDLSYGNRKKVGIVQALLHKPKLLILDEPTGGLDPLMQNKFFDLLIEEKKKGTTIFFSSHILSEVQKICDRVGIIKDGHLIKVEELSELTKVQYKKIRIEFDVEKLEHEFKVLDVKEFETRGKIVSFLYAGKQKQLLKCLEAMDPVNLWVEDPSLEEIFMYYYQ